MDNTTTGSMHPIANITPFDIFMTTLSFVLIVVITGGNILTIQAVAKFRSLHHQSNVMLAALAVADLMMGTVYTPLRLLRTHYPSMFLMRYGCIYCLYVVHFNAISAVVFLSMLSLERFYAIQFPFHYHAHATMKVALIFSILVYLFIAVALIPVIAGADNWIPGAECYAPSLYPGFYARIMVSMALIPLFLGFLAFLRVCYAQFKFRNQVSDQWVANMRKQESIRTTLIITAYFVSWCFWVPHLIYYLYDTISKAEQNLYLFRIVSIFDLASSAVNCFLYAWKNSKFKAAYKELLCLKPSAEAIRSCSPNT